VIKLNQRTSVNLPGGRRQKISLAQQWLYHHRLAKPKAACDCATMFTTILFALAPTAALIALGHALRRIALVQEVFWPQAERLVYYVLIPSLFFHSLATAHLDDLPVRALALTLVLSTVIVAAIMVALSPWLGLKGAQFTSVFQGSIRFNNYIGVTAAVGLFGAPGLALAALSNAAIVPTVNVLCVLVFARFGSVQLSLSGIMRQLAFNPLVVASVLGIAVQVLGFSLPPVIEPVLRSLAQASLPLGLICVGAALNFSAAGAWVRPIAIASAAKFGLMPLATIFVGYMMGLRGDAAVTALLFQALPTASSSYIMARQLGGDAELMAGIVAVQTVIAVLAIPLVMTLGL
jgi:predicted permease